MSRLVGVKELCELLSVSRSTLYKHWGRGGGPARIYIGRRVLVATEAAEEWIRSLSNTNPVGG